jgi:N-acetylneuraminic acid mutarotase
LGGNLNLCITQFIPAAEPILKLTLPEIGLLGIGKMKKPSMKYSMMSATSVGIVCLMALSVFAPVAGAAATPSWNYAFSMGGARSQATVVQADNGIVYVIGGYTTVATTATTLNSAYNPSTGTWTALAPLPFATRGASGGIGADGRIYIFDGTNTGTQIYNITTDSWSSGTGVPTVGNLWEAKSAMNGDKAYVFGGEGDVNYENLTSIYNITADSWSSGADMPDGVTSGAVVADSENAYYFGGENDSGLATANVSRYNFVADSWSIMAPMPSAVCAEGAAIGPDGLIYVFGGADTALNTGMGTVYSATYTYDRSSNTWATVDDLNEARAWLGAAVSDNKILAIGGNIPSAVFLSVESLDTLQNQLANLQNQVTLLQSQLAQANTDISGLDGDVSNLTAQNALLKAQLVELSAQLNQTNADLTTALEDTSDAKSTADSANMIGMIAVVLAVVAIVVAVFSIVLKKKS